MPRVRASARYLFNVGTMRSPSGTGSAPPGQKSFCMSTTTSAAVCSLTRLHRDTAGASLDHKALPQRIVLVHEERVLAGDPRRALDLGDNRRVVAHQRPPYDSAAMQRPDDALVNEQLLTCAAEAV